MAEKLCFVSILFPLFFSFSFPLFLLFLLFSPYVSLVVDHIHTVTRYQLVFCFLKLYFLGFVCSCSDTARIQFRLPDGSSMTEDFPSTSTLSVARQFVAMVRQPCFVLFHGTTLYDYNSLLGQLTLLLWHVIT